MVNSVEISSVLKEDIIMSMEAYIIGMRIGVCSVHCVKNYTALSTVSTSCHSSVEMRAQKSFSIFNVNFIISIHYGRFRDAYLYRLFSYHHYQ